MPNFDWKKLVKTVAPTIATVLGGPLAGMGVKAVSEAVLGNPNGTEEEIELALQGASPDTLQKLKAADQNFKIKMKELDIDVTRLDYLDADSARKREMVVKDQTPANLAYLLTLIFAGALAGLFWGPPIPPANKSLVTVLVGALGTVWIAAMAYYHGSSRGSARKDVTIQEGILKN